jgi:hypothetical protein
VHNGGYYFKQMADISLEAYTSWEPLWSGSQTSNYYDGNNYKIKHMSITSWTTTTQRYRGFFSRLAGNERVSNMVFDSCTIDFNITNYGYEDRVGFVAADGLTSVPGSATNIRVLNTCVLRIQGRGYRLFAGSIIGSGNTDNCISSARIEMDFTGGTDLTEIGGITGGSVNIQLCI